MKTLTTLLVASFLATPAFAYTDAAKYSNLLAQAQLTLSQAVITAEQHLAGKAVNAEIDQRLGKPVFEVEVLSGNKMFDVRIDAKNGQVMSVREDRD